MNYEDVSKDCIKAFQCCNYYLKHLISMSRQKWMAVADGLLWKHSKATQCVTIIQKEYSIWIFAPKNSNWIQYLLIILLVRRKWKWDILVTFKQASACHYYLLYLIEERPIIGVIFPLLTFSGPNNFIFPLLAISGKIKFSTAGK